MNKSFNGSVIIGKFRWFDIQGVNLSGLSRPCGRRIQYRMHSARELDALRRLLVRTEDQD
jgi:hypothetical protein